MNIKKNTQVIIYQSSSGSLELKGDFTHDTIWATQAQIAEIFDINQSVVSRHIRNIFVSGEISEKSNMQKMHIANSDKKVVFYSLDIILAVGYRVNSSKAISFRTWSSSILKQHLVSGYTINKKRIAKNYDNFFQAVESIRKLLPQDSKSEIKTVLDLISLFANTWFSLDAFDKENFPEKGITVRKVKLTANELQLALLELKKALLMKNQATDLFSKELTKDGLDSVVGNIFQSFGGRELYQSLEGKAANLLYVIVKNHPFVDGNKRSGAFAFIWFLEKFKIRPKTLTPEALTAITLLVAESNPKDKDKMVGLILLLLKN